MSSAAERVKILLRDLKQDTQHYDSLRVLLLAQRDAMIECNGEKTEEIGRELLDIYQQLHSSAQRRSATLSAFKLATDATGIQSLLPRLPPPVREQADSWWRSLELRASECQQLNERNGMLLNNQVEMLDSLINNRPEDYLYQR
ncbi:hypothetical protein CIG19_06105 [Enterobacterales bacterium CwR94]|nr:hypothetical protein CIG19_06105 [Enterobacterales bacterium CwR94]